MKLFRHQTDYLVLVQKGAQIKYFGIESGGRSRRYLDRNLLRPGFGGRILPGWTLHGEGPSLSGAARCCMTFPDERTFVIKLTATAEPLLGRLFQFAFAPDVTPPSLWAEPFDWARMENPLCHEELEPEPFVRRFKAPGLISFPEFGVLRCATDHDCVSLCETLVPDPANMGMNLGSTNWGNHNNRRAFHHGYFEVAFETDTPLQEVELHFTVMPEIVPNIPGCDFSDPKWNGLKRCWMNCFTLNPPTLSLGDNPILNGLGHLAIHWKADLSLFTPELLPGLSLQQFLRNTLELTFREHVDDDGKMTGYGWENGACNLIALHAYLLATGDWAFVRQYLPVIKKVISFNLALDSDNDGILEAAYHGNHFHDEKTSLNWWDAFAFGHRDAYGNLVYYQAFRRILPVLEQLGEETLAARVRSFVQRFPKVFHTTFYNPETGVYAGWISRDGRVHDYMFTFITAMAINEGIVDRERGKAMLEILWRQLEESGYGAFKYGVPGPAIPVDAEDRSDWGPMSDWGCYENGGFCGQTAYHFILALYKVGLRDKADKILFNMLDTFETMPTQSGLTTHFTESWDWRTRDGLPCGYNYLADNYVFLLAAIQGYFGIELPRLPAVD
ncbi:MAG: hypothetical protein D6820_05770 [Lentisphaerae bacterium]|nr:MAG: hypothetical protein D6820_05770 [Lentisphaerota bacterium]